MTKRGILKSASVALLAATATLAVAVPSASAITGTPGRIFANFDVGGTYGDLFHSKADGSWRRLTFGLGTSFGLSADPGGRFVTVTGRTGSTGPFKILRVSVGNRSVKNLIGNQPGFDPAVSPDGRKVAFLSTGSTGPTRLKLVSAKGGKPKTIYKFCSGCIYKTIWAGKRVYFNRRVRNNPSADFEIYSVRARDGKGLRQHTNDGGGLRDYRLFDVSPDGKRLLVVASDAADPITPNVLLAVVSNTNVYKRTVFQSGSSTDIFFGGALAPTGPAGNVIWLDVDSSPYRMWLSEAGSPWATGINAPAISTSGPLFMDWVRR